MSYTAQSGFTQSGVGWSGEALSLGGGGGGGGTEVVVPSGALVFTGYSPIISIASPVVDISAYVFDFDVAAILDYTNGVWTQRPSFLYDTYAAAAAGDPDANVFNGFNAEFSSSSSNPATVNRGSIATSDDFAALSSRMIYMGSGIPPFEKPVKSTDLPDTDEFSNPTQPTMIPVVLGVDLETGAWFVNNKYWFLGIDNLNGVLGVFSCASPGTAGNWTYVAANTGPPSPPLGVYYCPQNKTIYVLILTDVFTHACAFYSINIGAASPVWIGPFAAFDPTVADAHGIKSTFGEVSVGIVRFPNNDLGIYFQVGTDAFDDSGALYYAWYNNSTLLWDTPVQLLSQGIYGCFLLDPVDTTLVYVFAYLDGPIGTFTGTTPVCLTVTRTGSFATVFTFPTLTDTGVAALGFGHGVVVNNKLLIPLPDAPAGPFGHAPAFWFSSLGGTNFAPVLFPSTFINHFGAAITPGRPWLFTLPTTVVKRNFVGHALTSRGNSVT